MDPISAVGFATNIIQLVAVARDVVLIAKDVRRSKDGLSRNVEKFRAQAHLVCKELDELIEIPCYSPDYHAFFEYAKVMHLRIEEYLSKLDATRAKGSNNWSQALRAALRIWWKKDELEEGFKVIEEIGTQVATRIITIHVSTTSSKVSGVQEHNLQMEADLHKHMENLSIQINALDKPATGHDDRISQVIRKWFQDQEQMKIQRQCLEALYFPQMQTRENEVKDAHVGIFKWILDETPSQPNLPQKSHFRQWLQSQDQTVNVFWISGKPGSGKSTLMKYLANNVNLQTHFREWVKDRQCIIADCFFWKYGTAMQRSFIGLLRSLVYHILDQCPELIPFAFPKPEWLSGGTKFEFSRKSLENSLTHIMDSLQPLGFSLFIMIDGLDEFDDRGEHDLTINDEHDLISFLSRFYGKDAVKLCVSSRQLNTFAAEFGQDKSRYISMQELTACDIRAYVEEQLGQTQKFLDLVKTDSGYEDLVNDIVGAAEGVFLWVHLAVRSLLQGITNEDGITGLKRRLRDLSRELDHLYQHILDGIEPVYQRTSALMMLTLLEEDPDEFDPLIYYFIGNTEYDRLGPVNEIDDDQILDIHSRLSKKINAHCKGLLEETKYCPRDLDPPEDVKVLFITRVHGCHRSVFDFLTKSEVRSSLMQKASINTEELRLLIGKAFVEAIRVYLSSSPPISPDFDIACTLNITMAHSIPLLECFSKYVDRIAIGKAEFIWNELDYVISHPAPQHQHSPLVLTLMNRIEAEDLSNIPPLPESGLLAYLAYHSMGINFVRLRVQRDKSLLAFTNNRPSLLYMACLPSISIIFGHSDDVIEMLLTEGANPNQLYKGISPWQCFLIEAISYSVNCLLENMELLEAAKFHCTVEMFLKYDADMDALCPLVGVHNQLENGRHGPYRMTLHPFRELEKIQAHNSYRHLVFCAGDILRCLCDIFSTAFVVGEELWDILQAYESGLVFKCLDEVGRDLYPFPEIQILVQCFSVIEICSIYYSYT